MEELAQNVFTSECTYHTTLTVPQSGFYRVVFCYAHDNWDLWMKLDIVGENGETLCYLPPLPKKYTQTSMLLYLFQGTNQITATPRYDHPVIFNDVYLSNETPHLTPTVTPSCDCFYLDEPSDRRLMVVSYTGTPIAITEGDVALPFETEDKRNYENPNSNEQMEPFNYYHLKLSSDTLRGLTPGVHDLKIQLPQQQTVNYRLQIAPTAAAYEFQIVSLDVKHGNCALLRLPNGKNLLIDTGTPHCAKDVIFPYFEKHGLSLDYCLITHYHGDHMGSLDEILERYPLAIPQDAAAYIAKSEEERAAYLSKFQFLDSGMIRQYDSLDKIWDLGGVEITALNSRFDPNGIPAFHGENDTSVSLLVRYKGFQYYHGADNHAPNQIKNLEDFTSCGKRDALACHYMQANHHFHGDLYPEMIRAINPIAVLVPADAAIYSRSAFMVDYTQDVVEADYPNKHLKDTFVSYFSGTVTVLVNNGNDWHYETC